MRGVLQIVILLITATVHGSLEFKNQNECAPGCICVRRNATCLGRTSIPRNLPSSIESLILDDNHITGAQPNAFLGKTSLRYLSMQRCELADIHMFAFQGLNNMDRLSIKWNRVKRLTSYSMSGINNVSILDMSNNAIQIIGRKSFEGSGNIGSILLAGNPLSVIGRDAFYGLTGVGVLRLTNLHLHKIPRYAFRGLATVKHLELSGSRVDRIHKHAFHGLSNVTNLIFSNNSVDNMDSLAFKGMDKIGIFSLTQTQFKHCDCGCFDTIFDENRISHTYFSDNSMERCTCETKWMKQLPPHFQEAFICDRPERMQGLNMHSLDIKQFKCDRDFVYFECTPMYIVTAENTTLPTITTEVQPQSTLETADGISGGRSIFLVDMCCIAVCIMFVLIQSFLD